MTDMTTTRARRRVDPVRRERMIADGLDVVYEGGIQALTFRAVARRADVPLGSTTYHFADNVDLLREVLRLARERTRDDLDAALESMIPGVDLAVAIARLVERLSGERRAAMTMEHELFLSVLAHTELRDESRQWSLDSLATFARYTDEVTARTLAVFFDGICLHAVLFDEAYAADEVLPLIRAITGPAAP